MYAVVTRLKQKTSRTAILSLKKALRLRKQQINTLKSTVALGAISLLLLILTSTELGLKRQLSMAKRSSQAFSEMELTNE